MKVTELISNKLSQLITSGSSKFKWNVMSIRPRRLIFNDARYHLYDYLLIRSFAHF